MDANLTTAVVSASATAVVAITAILANNKRLDDLNMLMARLESRLEHIEQMLVTYALDVAGIKERLDIK